MVSVIVYIGFLGLILLALGYIMFDSKIIRRHRAILFYKNGKIQTKKAKRHSSGSAYSFLKFKDVSNTEAYSKGNVDYTFWYMDEGIPVPLDIDKETKKFVFPNIMAQEYMVSVRKNQQDKIKSGFFERHFESITGLIIIALGFTIYMYTVNMASGIDITGIQPLIEQFVYSQNQTEQRVSELAEILKNSRIPN